MKLIPAIAVSDANLTSSITEDDADVYDPAVTYAAGSFVIYDHKVYESAQGGNVGNTPPTTGTPITSTEWWTHKGATNKYKPFDKRIGDPATAANEITYTIDHEGLAVTSLALFGVVGTEVEVTITDYSAGVVYNETFSLLDETGVYDWFSYWFSPVGLFKSTYVMTYLPSYSLASTTITVRNPSGTVKIGQIVLGQITDIGKTLVGATHKLNDYSTNERDAYGNPVVVKRDATRVKEFPVEIQSHQTNRVETLLEKYRATPVVFVGHPDPNFGLIVYGYFQNFTITQDGLNVSRVSIEVESLN